MRNIRPIRSSAIYAMNRAASAGVHRFASAGFSGSRSVIPTQGFQVIRRAFTAAFSAAGAVASTRCRVPADSGTAASTSSMWPAFSRSSGRSPITGLMCTRMCDS